MTLPRWTVLCAFFLVRPRRTARVDVDIAASEVARRRFGTPVSREADAMDRAIWKKVAQDGECGQEEIAYPSLDPASGGHRCGLCSSRDHYD
jgi:hypothetical protein